MQQIMTSRRGGLHSKEPMQLQSIVSETVNLLGSTLSTTIDLKLEISPECNSVFIAGDASQIQEILLNLCNNAVYAMEANGELNLLLQPVELSLPDIPAQYEQAPGRYAKVSVSDTGCGMPAGMLTKIFDPFFTTKQAYEGAGMGLATVQGIIDQHGGIMTVDSAPELGTLFNLYFPIVEATATEPAPEKATVPTGTERILFVDDDEMLAALGEMMLSDMGYQVIPMTESTEAVALFTENADNIALIITDQTMPGMTGEELIHEIKKIKPDIPTIICTAFSSRIDDVTVAEPGIDAFLMKPVALSQLLHTVRRVLDKG